jgi:hypothetical protein
MANGGTAVTVFVDDAVQGRFPPVCARTGRPGDGRLTIDSEAVGSRSIPLPLVVVLLLVGPVGWAVYFVLSFLSAPGERLTVRLPWTADSQERIVALRRRKNGAWAAAAAGAAACAVAVVLVAGSSGGTTLTARVVIGAIVLASAVAAGVALVAEARLGRERVRVELDASRRWVTLVNVHPAFRQAVRADQARRTAPRP